MVGWPRVLLTSMAPSSILRGRATHAPPCVALSLSLTLISHLFLRMMLQSVFFFLSEDLVFGCGASGALLWQIMRCNNTNRQSEKELRGVDTTLIPAVAERPARGVCSCCGASFQEDGGCRCDDNRSWRYTCACRVPGASTCSYCRWGWRH